MSKFLKFIVNLVIICGILVAAALLVPPFAGVNTVMNDNSSKETNLPTGSVAYGRDVEASELKKGDRIIYTGSNQAYVYEITDMDSTAGTYKVQDVYNQDADETSVQLVNDASRVVVVVPYIAYAAIALQSKEGLIVVGLGIIFLIILFILAELWRKDDDDEDEEDEEEEESQESDDEDEEEEEEGLSRKERRQLKKEEKRRRKLEKKGLLEEDDSEDAPRALKAKEKSKPAKADAGETQETPVSQKEQQPEEFESAMKDAMASIAEGIAMVQSGQDTEKALSEESEVSVPEVSAPDDAPQAEVLAEEAEDVTVEAASAVNLEAVLPAPSVTELLSKAEAAGEKPEVIEDKDNDVTLLDYSELL